MAVLRERSVPRRRVGPPRVAYVMSRFPKVSETFVLYEMITLEKLGAEIELCPLLRERQPVRHPEVEPWMRRARFHPFLSWRILRAQAHFLRHRPRAYLRTWREVLGGTMGSANFFFGALGILPKAVRLAYELREAGVSHVHAHFATHPAVAALIVHRLTGLPFSFTAHGSDLHVERRMLDRKVEAAAFVVTVSRYNRDLIVRECGRAAEKKVRVVHCGVDASLFAYRARRREQGPFQIVCVASLEPVKGHRYLIEACRMLDRSGIPFRCHLVGDGPLRKQLEARVEEAGLRDRVLVHGPLPRPAVLQRLADADVAVLPSRPTPDGKREGIPVSLMEAMATGLPVVSTRISGIPELVESGEEGLLVPPGDPVALARALERLLGDVSLRDRMGRAARRKVVDAFDLETNARELLDLVVAHSGPDPVSSTQESRP